MFVVRWTKQIGNFSSTFEKYFQADEKQELAGFNFFHTKCVQKGLVCSFSEQFPYPDTRENLLFTGSNCKLVSHIREVA